MLRLLIAAWLVSFVSLDAEAAAAPRQRDAATKRCAAAERRVERQVQVIADLELRLARNHDARARCSTGRACNRVDRALKADEARRAHYERQLAQYRIDATNACGRG
jgi:hypothetical protein